MNLALRTVTYQPAQDYYGEDFLTLTVNDLGNTGIGGPKEDEIRVNFTVTPVNDPPIWTVPFTSETELVQLTEDTVYALQGITLDDVDGTDDPLREMVINATTGWLVFTNSSGLTYHNCSADTLCESIFIKGSLSSLKNALQYVDYQPPSNWHGKVNFTFWTFDAGIFGDGENGTDEAIVQARVNAVADEPSLTALDISGIEEEILDVTITIGLSDIDGSEYISSIVVSGLPSGEGVFQGPVLNGTRATYPPAADGSFSFTSDQLEGLAFLPTFTGERTLTVEVNATEGSNGDFFTALTTFDVTVFTFNDAPLIGGDWVDGSTTMSEDQTLTISGPFYFTDVDAGDNEVKVTLTSSTGTMELSNYAGLTVTGMESTSITLVGTIDELNAAFSHDLIYQPPADWNGVDTITVFFSDEGYSGQMCPAGSCESAQRCDLCAQVRL